jgi:hypothetical protein
LRLTRRATIAAATSAKPQSPLRQAQSHDRRCDKRKATIAALTSNKNGSEA